MKFIDLHRRPLKESKRALASIISNIYLLDEEGNKHSFAYGDFDYVTEYANKITQGLKREDRVVWASRYFLKLLLMELKWLVGEEDREDTSKADRLLKTKAIWPPEMEKKLRNLDWIGLDELPEKAIWLKDDEIAKRGITGQHSRLYARGAEMRAQKKKMTEFLRGISNDPEAQALYIDHVTTSTGIEAIVKKIKHYLGIGEVYSDREPNNPVLAYEFKKQPFSKVVRDLGRLAAPLQRKYASTDVEEGETVVELPDGWKWVLLSSAYCRKEGKAMGHCGNVGPNANDQVMSLREPADEGHWTPHLTFIWNNGELGEMKGRKNAKPSKKYHNFIVALLQQDMITTVRGGGYKPQNNFHLADLDVKTQLMLYVSKPSLFAVEGVSPELESLVYSTTNELAGSFINQSAADFDNNAKAVAQAIL